MNTLLDVALSNVVMAAVLALPALVVGFWGRRPAWTHGLWLLVLLKLVTPPLVRVPIALPEPPAVVVEMPLEDPVPEAAELVVAEPAEPIAAVEAAAPPGVFEPPPEPIVAEPLAPALAAEPIAWSSWVGLLWLAGALGWYGLAARRLDRFQRLLRFARPAPVEVQTEAAALAGRLGVSCPDVLVLPGRVSPMLWAVGRPARLLLPADLLARLPAPQRTTLLVHELAHWRRRDHRVRWLEVVTLGLYWWCPLAWWACRQLRQAEEECCDAWVVAVLPEAARAYALALVETIDFLSGAAVALPPAASGAGHVRRLHRRLTMIMHGTTPQALPRVGMLVLGGLGLALLPFVPGLAQPQQVDRGRDDFAQRSANQQKVDGEIQQAVQQADAEKLKQMLQAFEKAQRDLQQQERQLREALRALATPPKAVTPAEGKGGMSRPGGPGRPAGPPGGGMVPPGMSMIPPGVSPPVPTPPLPLRPGTGSSVEQRLEQMEKKLDTLLWEVTNLRRELQRGHVHGGPIPVMGDPLGPVAPTAPPPGSRAVAPMPTNVDALQGLTPLAGPRPTPAGPGPQRP